VFIASLPASFATLKMPCTAVACSEIVGQLTVVDVQALQKLGLSLDTYAYYWITLNSVVGLAWCLMGGILVWRKSNDWLVLLVALMLISVGTGAITDNLLLRPSLWLIPENWLYLIKSLAVLFSLALFPNGRFVPRWTGWIPLIYPAQMVCYLLFLHQLHVPGWSLYRNPLNAVAWFGCEGVLAAAQLYRYLRVSNRVERQQTKWVAFSFLILLLADFGETATVHLVPIQHIGLLYVLILSVFTCMFFAFPFAVGIAILRSRLWDIDIIINRALVYGLLTVCIVGIYVFVVGYLGALLHSSGSLPVSLLATGLVAILFQPLRERLQRGANRLLYGQRDNPYQVISRLGQRLEAALEPEAVLSTLVETVAQALKLPYTAITLKQGDEFIFVASYGKAVETTLTLPLLYQTEAIGQLLLAPRAKGEGFSPADRRLLDDLARQAGIAAHAVRLTTELQRARERLVTTREEERRRLRRDLHDGLGPTLAALNLQAGAVRLLIPQDPAEATALVVEWRTTLRAVIADIRRLVYELRPPALDELGLIGAMREQAAQYSAHAGTNGVQMTVEAPDQLPSLPAAVEVAAYRIAQEALANVAQHAQAHTCRLHLWLDNALHLEISDDGIGLPEKHRSGVGLFSIRERAEELGGSCSIASAVSRGTRVSARLPFPKDFFADHLSEGYAFPSDDAKPGHDRDVSDRLSRSRESGAGGLDTEGGS